MITLLCCCAGDHTPDLAALLAADVIIATPEKWDGISRNWQTRGYVKKVCQERVLGAMRCRGWDYVGLCMLSICPIANIGEVECHSLSIRNAQHMRRRQRSGGVNTHTIEQRPQFCCSCCCCCARFCCPILLCMCAAVTRLAC
jgi:hypothetical protein